MHSPPSWLKGKQALKCTHFSALVSLSSNEWKFYMQIGDIKWLNIVTKVFFFEWLMPVFVLFDKEFDLHSFQE